MHIAHHWQQKTKQNSSRASTLNSGQTPVLRISTGGAAAQAWGSSTALDELTIRANDAVTIGIATTSADPRVRHYVVTLVHHTIFAGEM